MGRPQRAILRIDLRPLGQPEHGVVAPEEIERYEQTKISERALMAGNLVSANYSNSSADQAQYNRDLAEYEANSSDIESISQIKGDGAPERNNVKSYKLVDRKYAKVTAHAFVAIWNHCADDMPSTSPAAELQSPHAMVTRNPRFAIAALG